MENPELDRLRSMSPDRFGLLIKSFIDGTDKYISVINSSLESKDCKSMCDSAHPLKSSSASLGFYEISDIAGKLEYISEHGDLDGAEDLVKEVVRIYARVRLSLEDELKELGSKTASN